LRLLSQLLHTIRNEWDPPARAALLLALASLVLSTLLILTGPETFRLWFLLAGAGTLLLIQGIVLWGNRTMIRPVPAARQAYLRGDYARARRIMERYTGSTGASDPDGWSLLGSAQRQTADLANAEASFGRAIYISPRMHIAHYGRAWVWMVKGDYEAALQGFRDAKAFGAPEIVTFEIGLCLYLLGNSDEALATLSQSVRIDLMDEPNSVMSQHLIGRLLGYRRSNQPVPQSTLDYWRTGIARYRPTPFTKALEEEVRLMSLTGSIEPAREQE
jgi:tetratricopeptide (TPR) repeat protein